MVETWKDLYKKYGIKQKDKQYKKFFIIVVVVIFFAVFVCVYFIFFPNKIISPTVCPDNTPYGQCSSLKPMYCDNGSLVEKCSICGCIQNYSCNNISNSCKLLPSAPLPTIIFDDGTLHNSLGLPSTREISQKFYQSYADKYDFLLIFTTTPHSLLTNNGFHTSAKNDINGIGLSIFDSSKDFGSSGKLLGVSFVGAIDLINGSYGLTVEDVDKADGSVYELIFHEISHQWLVHVGCLSTETCVLPMQQSNNPFHWDIGLFSPYEYTITEANNKWIDNDNGTFTSIPKCPLYYFQRFHPLDLYLMGFKNASEISDTYFIVRPDEGYAAFNFACNKPTTVRGTKISFSVQDIIKMHGERIPNALNSQKDFSLAIILLESSDYPATQEMKYKITTITQNAPAIWNWLIEGRSRIVWT